MAEEKTQQPVYIMPEGTQRTLGRDAQRNNILAARIVAETVRTTLGPKGMDKMLVDSIGDTVVTNDGVTILEEMQIEHPAAKMIVEIAKTQESEVGDGTTTAVILAGELLKNAEQLLDQNIHPTVIIKGYRIASEVSQKILHNIAIPITEKDDSTLRKIAVTAMNGRCEGYSKQFLAKLAVDAVKQISEDIIDTDNIKVEKKTGGSIENSELIQGIILDKERVHDSMPRSVKNAKIALIDSAIEIKDTEMDAKIQITDPEQMQAFIDQEENMIRTKAEKIINSGASVVFCQKGVDEVAQHYLSKAGIYVCRRIKQDDMDKLARATGAKVVTNLDDLSSKDLGNAGIVEEVKIGDEEMTYVRNCKNPKSVTILIRGGTEHVIDEIERAMKDSIGDIASALKYKKVVSGAGSCEIEVARNLRLFSNTLKGREQLAVLAFADAIEVIPRTLSENAGLDPIDKITELKNIHDKGKKDSKFYGLDVFSGKIVNAWAQGVIEPLKIKTQAVKSASEVAELILRIDDIIAAGNLNKESGPSMPGM